MASNSTLNIDKKSIICYKSKDEIQAIQKFQGNITIGPGTIMEPHCQILAINGPIIIGSNNVIEDCVIIQNNNIETLHIGSNNKIEISSIIECSIGDGNVIGRKAHLFPQAHIENGIDIAPMLEIKEQISSETVVWGSSKERWKKTGNKEKHIENLVPYAKLLSQTLPETFTLYDSKSK